MKISLFAIAFAVLGLFGGASAKGDETFTIDLKSVTGHTYYLCSSTSSAQCGVASVWEESNTVDFLQASTLSTGSQRFNRDALLLS